jgi:hypothetical protein
MAGLPPMATDMQATIMVAIVRTMPCILVPPMNDPAPTLSVRSLSKTIIVIDAGLCYV